jgi:hypothetical protein
VVGNVGVDELSRLMTKLEPDDIDSAENFGIPADVLGDRRLPAFVVWWN